MTESIVLSEPNRGLTPLARRLLPIKHFVDMFRSAYAMPGWSIHPDSKARCAPKPPGCLRDVGLCGIALILERFTQAHRTSRNRTRDGNNLAGKPSGFSVIASLLSARTNEEASRTSRLVGHATTINPPARTEIMADVEKFSGKSTIAPQTAFDLRPKTNLACSKPSSPSRTCVPSPSDQSSADLRPIGTKPENSSPYDGQPRPRPPVVGFPVRLGMPGNWRGYSGHSPQRFISVSEVLFAGS